MHSKKSKGIFNKESSRVLLVLNVSLSFVAFLLILGLFDITLPSAGEVIFLLDSAEPSCLVEWQGETNGLVEMDRCCLEARKQLRCEPTNKMFGEQKLNWDCYTGFSNEVSKGRVLHYLLNNKGMHYCGIRGSNLR